MTNLAIRSWIMQAIRNKLHQDQVTAIIDAAQKIAFSPDLKAFLVWTETLTPQFYLEFVSGGYVSAIAGDIGKTVTGGTSGATGTLVSYNNTTRKWLIDTTDDFTDAEAITISTGTGAGTLLSSAAQTGYLGPYSAPTSPACKRIWGVTTATEENIFGVDPTLAFPMNDFDFILNNFDPKSFFKPGREDNLSKTFTFASAPGTGVTYRWVYWRTGPTVDILDDTTLLIPSEFHLWFINACVKLAQINISGEDVDPKLIDAMFEPWWSVLRRPYTPMGKASNRTLNSRDRSGSMI